MSMPENLLRLHGGEETLRTRAVSFVNQFPDLADHLDMMEKTMDVLDMLRKHYRGTEDEKTISLLGMRCFNDFAAAWKLCASGYYQSATAQLRDLIETSELVDYFYGDPAQIEVWRMAERKQLINDFGPSAIRKALDKRTGLGKSRREEIYHKFCTLASHPSVNGFAMLRPAGSEDAVIGPFSDLTALRAVVEETGMLAARVGFAFVLYLDLEIDTCNQIAHRFITGVMDYSGKYLGKAYSQQERDEVDRLYLGARQS